MQTWAKRGLQSALVTGGLLMLGTGIASADENVNPDSPAGPLDVNVKIPVDIADNAVAGPNGQHNLPEYHGEISTEPITGPVNSALQRVENAAPMSGKATSGAAAVADRVSGAVNSQLGGVANQGAVAKQAAQPSDEPLRGNKVDLDITAPIQITGNALGIGGDAVVESHQTQTYANHQNTTTDGSGQSLAGNAIVLDWALPVQLSGNAAGVLGGSGTTSGSATQSVSETGNITTDGSDGVLSGNVGAAQFATPVQVTGNAVGGLIGQADSDFAASTEAESGGWVRTNGDDGVLSGNAGAGPLALPLKGNGNAVSPLGGITSAQSWSSADATAGGTKPGLNDIPAYVETSGNEGAGSGNIIAPQGAGVGSLAGNAASLIGTAATGNAVGDDARATGGSGSSSEVKSGGFVNTFGNGGTGSGNIISAPIAGDGEVFGNGLAAIGNSDAQHNSYTDATAGDGTFSAGNDATLSGNTVTAPVGLAGDVFGSAGAAIGNATATAGQEKVLDAGGYNGTQGNNSSGSGNLVQVPVGGAGELFGIAGAAAGQAEAIASEDKTIDVGGPGNTEDDNAALSSNLVAAPVALPAQGFGIGGALLGNATGAASSDTDVESGGWYHASGVGASGSGNIVQAPIALPVQGHGLGLAGGGNATGVSDNMIDAVAGGEASTDGHGGSFTGNIVQAPVGGALGAFGLAAGGGGNAFGGAKNNVSVESGGDTSTNGDAGSVAGNVVSAQAMPILQAFGDAGSLGGIITGVGYNATDVSTGGDVTTSGDGGSLSGNILDVPAGAVGQAFGDALSLGGIATGVGHNKTTGVVGGETETSGNHQSGSGFDAQIPVGVLAQVYDVSAELLGQAFTSASNDTNILVGNEEPQLDLIVSDKHLGANELPSLPSMNSFGGRSVELPAQGLPAADLPAADILGSGVFSGDLLGGDLLSGAALTNLPNFAQVPAVAQPSGRSALPTETVPAGSLPTDALSTDGLGQVSELAQLPELNTLPVEVPRNGAPSADMPLPLNGNLVGQLPADLPSTDGVNVTPQAQLPAMQQLDSTPLSVVDGFSQGLSNTPLDIR